MNNHTRVGAWTLEAPDSTRQTFSTARLARAYLEGLAPELRAGTWRRLAPGCYRFDPPIAHYPLVWVGPWLLYSALGREYLAHLEPRPIAGPELGDAPPALSAYDGL